MIDSYYRTTYQKIFVDPLLQKIQKVGITPNMLTLLALISGVAIFPALALGYSWMAILFLGFSGYLDTLDGSLARKSTYDTPKGAVLDIVSDRIVEFSIILGLFSVDPNRALLCIFMLGSILICITSFLVVGIFTKNQGPKSFYYSPGLIERTEAFIFFFLMMLFPLQFPFFAFLFTALVSLTAFIRIFQFKNYELG